MAQTPLQIVTAYCEAWNVPDANTRRALLEKSWADGGTYADPGADLTGRAALFAHISRIVQTRPGSRIVMTSGVDLHHHCLRFEWKLVNGAGATVIEGIDFGELAADGRLQKIVGFFGPVPDPPT